MTNPHPTPSPSTMQSTLPHTTTSNKDLLSRLPPEILRQILLFLPTPLHYSHRTILPLSPLLPLLCVSKHLAHATLQLVYDSPYIRPYDPNRKSKRPPRLDEEFENPTRRLLQRNSKAKECKVLDLVYRLSKDTIDATIPDATNPDTDCEAISVLDYTAHIRYVNPTGLWTIFPEHQISPRVVEYLKKLEEEEEESVLGVELDQLPPEYLERFGSKWDFVLRCFHVELHRQVIWYVAEPILEQLRGLSIPISDIDRYREVIDRFESLEQVSFILDEAFDFDARRVSHRPMHPEWVGIRRESRVSQGKIRGQWTGKERKAKAMRKMIEFVREHARLFRGRLTKATCSDVFFWPDNLQSCPEDIHIEMLASIPPAPKLKSLSRSEWLSVKAHPETIDFCWVESIDLSWFKEPVCKGMSNDWVLPRCRRLKSLSTRPFGPDGFRWALKEKRDLESLASCSIPSTADTSQLDRKPAYIEYGLVPVEKVLISEERFHPFCDEEVNDVAIAFSRTLTSLQLEGDRISSISTTLLKHLHLGRGWVDMLALTELRIYMPVSDYRVVLDRELLAHCPNIMAINITDGTWDYDYRELVPCLSAYLPKLRSLYLCGWSALTFDPETLSLTPGLCNLTIGVAYSDWSIVFIPPVAELYQSFGLLGETAEDEGEEDVDGTGERIVRSRWTWDWHLPMLRELCLLGEFAYLFQFKMLTGCPQLKYLTLHIRTNDFNGQPRVITEADLFIAGTGQTRERIVAERVTDLSLKGIWVVENETILSQFLVDMFPNMTELNTRGGSNGGGVFSSLGLGSMMSIIRDNPKHKWTEVQTELEEPRRQEALNYGLCHPEWEADTLDLETVETLGVKILFRDGNEDEYDYNDFFRVLKVLDFERDVSWAVRDDALPSSPIQVPWVGVNNN
ncbi:MAG: hypothetical protein JOS17DRAFT_765921 [Linnemannia elongata]|nr:MAG: hypothetical protein JOS17DRAFT_765921 [Linnemannia elongata]